MNHRRIAGLLIVFAGTTLAWSPRELPQARADASNGAPPPLPIPADVAAALATIRSVPTERPEQAVLEFDPTVASICATQSQWACRAAYVRLWRRGESAQIDGVRHELETACTEGDTVACGMVCLLRWPFGLAHDRVVSRDYAGACQLACDRGDTMVCGELDYVCHVDRTLLPDPDRTCANPVELLEAACAGGSATACVRRFSEVPYIGSVSREGMLAAFLRACRLGAGTACSGAATLIDLGSVRHVEVPADAPSVHELELRACAASPRSHSCGAYCTYAAAQTSPAPHEEFTCDRSCAMTTERYCEGRAALDLARTTGPDDPRTSRALEGLRHECEDNRQSDACRRLVPVFESGVFVARNVARARRYQRLAERFAREPDMGAY